MEVSDLPLINASLNALSGVLLLAGYICIRLGNKKAHARLMVSAFVVSSLFLGCYLTYHYLAGSTPYEGGGFCERSTSSFSSAISSLRRPWFPWP